MRQEINKTKIKDTFDDSMKRIDKSYKKIVYWTNYLNTISSK